MNRQTIVNAVSELTWTYVAVLPTVFYRLTLSLFLDPKGSQKFLHQVLNAIDLTRDDPKLGSADIVDLVSGNGDVRIEGAYYAPNHSETRVLLELASLGYLVRNLRSRLIFEIGTFIGRTTRLLAVNSQESCKILTLDLHPSQVDHEIGKEYIHTPEAFRIQQLHGDSRTFDFSPWYGRCDFVWVDASHDYESVKIDTDNALRLCRAGGWIGWHDYRHTAWWSGVTRCVRELHARCPGVRHLRGTTIALLQKVK